MAYITRANFRRISYQLDKNFINKGDVDNVIICEDLPNIKFGYLNTIEKQALLAFKYFVLHPEIILKPEYQKISNVDTKKYIFESVAAYHNDPKCEKLNQDFNGILLPDEIKQQGDKKIEEFRQWYKDNMHYLYEDKIDIFEMHLENKWGIHRSNIGEIYKKNSGSMDFYNYTIEEVCNEIKKLSESFKQWLLDDAEKTELRKYSFLTIAYNGKCTYLGDDSFSQNKHLAEINRRNHSKYSDQEIADCLKEAHNNFKLPIIEYIKKYYMIKYNADCNVEKSVLDSLGFKPCYECYKMSEFDFMETKNIITFNNQSSVEGPLTLAQESGYTIYKKTINSITFVESNRGLRVKILNHLFDLKEVTKDGALAEVAEKALVTYSAAVTSQKEKLVYADKIRTAAVSDANNSMLSIANKIIDDANTAVSNSKTVTVNVSVVFAVKKCIEGDPVIDIDGYFTGDSYKKNWTCVRILG